MIRARKFGAPRPELPRDIARLLQREERRIEKLTRELIRTKRALQRARDRKQIILRLGNDELRRNADGAE